jgi:DNA transformation protein
MAVDESFLEFVEDQLTQIVSIRSRRMFGGVGIYGDDFFFAIIADDTLYFKVDDTNRPDFEAAGMGPFLPYGDPTKPMQYYRLPADLLEDVDALVPWVRKAISVARRAAS